LQIASVVVNDACQLGESNDALTREVADMGKALKWQKMVFAERVKRNRASDHQLVIGGSFGKVVASNGWGVNNSL
jgi:hypothetical protein